MILTGHNLETLRTLPAASVQCVVTSPPYWGLRNYGTHPQTWADGWRGELGSEPTPAAFVAHLVEIFSEVARVLRDDGTLWLNLGDSYSGNGAAFNDQASTLQGAKQSARMGNRRFEKRGLPAKNLVGIPWRVAFALQAAGWYLRQEIIWHKPNPMPEAVRDRCTRSHESVFLLTKSPRYFFDQEAIKTPTSEKTLSVKTTPRKGTGTESTGEKLNAWMEDNGGRYHPATSNRRSVWSISTQSYKGAHFATFPPALIEPCILAGTSAAGCCPNCGKPWRRLITKTRTATRPGKATKTTGDAQTEGNRDPLRHVTTTTTTGWAQDCACPPADAVPCTVLDPFGGSGTTAIVAEHYKRKWILCELSEDYAALARERIAKGWKPKRARARKPAACTATTSNREGSHAF